MEKTICILILILFLTGFVYSSEGWDSYSDEEFNSIGNTTQTGEGNVSQLDSSESLVDREVNFNQKSSKSNFTENFYYALGAGFFAILVFILLIYLLLKKPRNSWDKK
jgi:asparagine N-glycosylation enzyme membrane subunit Stt3